MHRLRVLLYILAPLLLLAGGLEFMLFETVSTFKTPPKPKSGMEPNGLLLSSNDITFVSDGAQLKGWLIIGKPQHPAIIIAHGYASSRSEVLGKLENLISTLNKKGYFIFLFDFRGHGDSTGTSTLGYSEGKDLEAALQTVLKYKTIDRRIAILGIGMGAVAATEAAPKADEVKFVMLDSIYEDISGQCNDAILKEWSMLSFAGPLLIRLVDWNLRKTLQIQSTHLPVADRMPKLYPRPVLFIEKEPLRSVSKNLYDATEEPKELIQLSETAQGELIGETRENYNNQLHENIEKYFPAQSDHATIELKH